MAKDQNLEEVLIARNNETGEVGAVTGLNEDGTPKPKLLNNSVNHWLPYLVVDKFLSFQCPSFAEKQLTLHIE